MHDIEPYYLWQHLYQANEDERSPFYGREYSEFEYSQTIYNFYIHPQWDFIGSRTLYIKVIYADYEQGFLIAELLGEWNDAIHNDIMFLKRDIMDVYRLHGIHRFILIGENILNFHGSDDSYYEEWNEELSEEGGWVSLVNFRPHVLADMRQDRLHYYLHIHEAMQDIPWRKIKPDKLPELIENQMYKALG